MKYGPLSTLAIGCLAVMAIIGSHASSVSAAGADDSTATFNSAASGSTPGDLLAELKLDIIKLTEALSSISSSSIARPSSSSFGGDKCCECARGVGQHVLESTLRLVDDKCSSATCPVIKARCKWIEEHKEEFTGYLVAKIRPMHDGFVYCMGNGTCAHPNSTSAESLSVSFAEPSPQLLLSQLSASSVFVARGLAHVFPPMSSSDEFADMTDDESLENPSELLIADGEPEDQSDSASPDVSLDGEDGFKRSKCHRCLRHSVRYVMKRAIRHLKHVCKHTKCPFTEKFCAFAKDHKKFVRGIIYEHVQPFKYAIGYCAGRGKCHHATAQNEVAKMPFSMKGSIDSRSKESNHAMRISRSDSNDHSKKMHKVYKRNHKNNMKRQH